MRQIAQESGVSITAVSLAMRGSSRVSQQKTDEPSLLTSSKTKASEIHVRSTL